jgi:hypothetical protein
MNTGKFSLMKGLLLFAVFLIAGCAAPTKLIKFDSDPPGARVFIGTGDNEDIAKGGRNYIGQTPCQWTTEIEGDGTFKRHGAGIPFYSDFVQSVVVVTFEPPSTETNLFAHHDVFHLHTAFQPGTKVPDGIFFDMHKP